MNAVFVEGYNERLFSGDALRRFYHLSRFRWLKERISQQAQAPLRVVELGCFDARTLDYLPRRPQQYVGLDANWEGGLDEARQKLSGRPEVSLIEATEASVLKQYEDGQFDTAVALETLEHIPSDLLRDYLAELARVTRGCFYISVPNEMGPVFLAKYLVKRMAYGGTETYSGKEVIAATLRQSHKVERNEHKGFDYRTLIKDMDEYFRVTRVEGIPFAAVPSAISLTVGITAVSRGIG